MLKNFINKERLPAFRSSSFLLLSAFCMMLIGPQANAADAKIQLSDDVQASSHCGCKGDDSDSQPRGRHTQNRRECCPGPKGPQGPRGPVGFPACPGTYTDFASYSLILLPNQTTVGPTTLISFGRQTVLRGHSIRSFPPFNKFELEAGIYEISLVVSTQNVNVAQQNQVVLNVGGKTFTFPAQTQAAPATDFITYRKIIQVFLKTDVTVSTTIPVTFAPPTAAETSNPGLAAYIHFVRIY